MAGAFSLPARVGLALALIALPTTLSAQVPDTARTPRDSLDAPGIIVQPAEGAVLVDTIPVPEDSLAPAWRVPPDTIAAYEPWRSVLPEPVPAGFAEAVWVWERDDLLRSTALSLGGLLEQVPGLARLRAGYFGLPETVTGAGAAGGDVRVYLDGYALDPAASATIDLSRIDLVNLERVRVERRGGRIRIELTTLAWVRDEPHTVVEGATGDMDTEALAGAFRAPRFLFGPISGSLSRLTSDGVTGAEPAERTGGWLKWGWLRPDYGVHVEYRQVGTRRGGELPLLGEGSRSDVILRARAAPTDWLVGEVYAGRSSAEEQFLDTLDVDATQLGGRVALDLSFMDASGALRLRQGDALGPAFEMEGTARSWVLPYLTVGGGARFEHWERGASFVDLDASVVAGPLFGASVFAQVSHGERGVPFLYSPGGRVRATGRSTLRAGAEWGIAGWRLGAAALRLEGSGVAPPALPGLQAPPTTTALLYPGFGLEGFEATAAVPLYLLDGLALEASYTWLRDAGPGEAFGREYGGLSVLQPLEQARGGILYHGLPLGHDQLEVFARVESEYRGGFFALAAAGDPDRVPGAPVLIDATHRYNLDLQVRVLSVRAFVHFGNVLHELDQQDVPGRPLPGQHAYFGVKWELQN